MLYNEKANNNVGGIMTIDNFITQQINLKSTCLASNHLLIVSSGQKA